MLCNVIVYEQAGKTFVASIMPTLTMQVTGNETLCPLAEQVEQKLKKAIDSI